jgi:SPP1 gp7 family putative phage head morphogenesis protein
MPKPAAFWVMEKFNRDLARLERAQILEMTRRWTDLEKRLDGDITKLSLEIADRIKNGLPVTKSSIITLERYKQLVYQVGVEAGSYQNYARDLIKREQVAYGKKGLEAAKEATRQSYLEAGKVMQRFDILPIEAIQNMVGMCGDGKPLFDLLQKRAIAPYAVEGMTKQLIEATAKGDNPRVTARMIKNGLAQGLTKALVIARTEQIRVYRQATIDQYIASGVVTGFIRHAALNERTCIACLALDGKRQDTDELFENHPDCRCFITPIIDGLQPIEGQSGADWLSGQSEAKQREILGPHYDLYQAGTPITDMVKIKDDATWGPTIAIKPVGELE